MFALFPATPAVTALFLVGFFFNVAALAGEVPASLVIDLEYWLDENTDLPRSKMPPRIVIAAPETGSRPSELATLIGQRPRGTYEEGSGQITLFSPWSAANPQDIAILLHELFHHRQSAIHSYCLAARELDAYRVQRDWLAARELRLDVNWVAIVLASSCAPRDIHPD